MFWKLGSKIGAAASIGLAGAVGGFSLSPSASRMFSVSAKSPDNIYQFSARDIDGNQVTGQFNLS